MIVEWYDVLFDVDCGGVFIFSVLQGYVFDFYWWYLDMYGSRLRHGAWVGVGSVCKRNGSAESVLQVLMGIKRDRPDLRLHGFGLKGATLLVPEVARLLFSADSMAWSRSARAAGRTGNDPREALRWRDAFAPAGVLRAR